MAFKFAIFECVTLQLCYIVVAKVSTMLCIIAPGITTSRTTHSPNASAVHPTALRMPFQLGVILTLLMVLTHLGLLDTGAMEAQTAR